MTKEDKLIKPSTSTAPTRRRSDVVGVLGLGIMGGAIARNLLRAGYKVVGFDPDPNRSTESQEAGVEIMKSAAPVAAAADLLLTSLPSPEALDETTRAIADLPESERQRLGQSTRGDGSERPKDCRLSGGRHDRCE